MFDYADNSGHREVYQPMAEELARQQEIFSAVQRGEDLNGRRFEFSTSALDWAAHVMEDRTDTAAPQRGQRHD
jgi:hypothetical protein